MTKGGDLVSEHVAQSCRLVAAALQLDQQRRHAPRLAPRLEIHLEIVPGARRRPCRHAHRRPLLA